MDGSLVIDAQVVAGTHLCALGVCARTEVEYIRGTKHIKSKQMHWSMCQEVAKGPDRKSTPFAGLFDAMKEALRLKRMLSTPNPDPDPDPNSNPQLDPHPNLNP